MAFSSPVFLSIFLPLVLCAYRGCRSKGIRCQNGVLLSASVIFYAWGEPAFMLLLAGSLAFNWQLGLRLDATTGHYRRGWLTLGIAFNLALLFFFKYWGFFAQALTGGRVQVALKLPIGISFFTFQVLSYLIDVYRAVTPARKNGFDLALYICLFPQLVAGPIVRYQTIADEIDHRQPHPSDLPEGIWRFVQGLAKKVLIADYAAALADRVFDARLEGLTMGAAWIGLIAYALQIYFDFSGYSDMAIGLGRMFGFHFNENFRYPYCAASITDFWRRWHISLSEWFRDYVYIPLGGNRVGPVRRAGNLMFVWFLTGLWHGANWTFIAWGLYWGVLLLIERWLGKTRLHTWYSHLYTLFAILMSWVLFRANTLADALQYYAVLFAGPIRGDALTPMLIGNLRYMLPVSALACTPWFTTWLRRRLVREEGWTPAGDRWRAVTMLALFCASLVMGLSSADQPFLYFNF